MSRDALARARAAADLGYRPTFQVGDFVTLRHKINVAEPMPSGVMSWEERVAKRKINRFKPGRPYVVENIEEHHYRGGAHYWVTLADPPTRRPWRNPERRKFRVYVTTLLPYLTEQ